MEHREKINKTLTLFLLSVEKQKTSLQDFKLEVNTSGTLEIIHIQKGLIPTECLATGEKHLFYFMYLFALRNVIDKNFPLIIDDPFGRLDRELKNAMYRLIEQINSQVMILGFHDDCQKLKPNKKYGLLFHDQKRKTKIIRLTL